LAIANGFFLFPGGIRIQDYMFTRLNNPALFAKRAGLRRRRI